MDFLKELGIEPVNAGVCTGPARWSESTAGGVLESINPATNEPIASVHLATEEDYEHVIREAQRAFEDWRAMPAPARGEVVRQIGLEVRRYKSQLGSLVALENGKIKEEGDGEVQELIDMADFAVGQSRMLYGKTMQSERPGHRMYEQWHPLGLVGVITAFNFPVAVWSWNALVAAACGNVTVWKPSPKTPLTSIALQHICNRVMEANGLTGIFNVLVTDRDDLAARFVADRRVPLISFTGSTAVGRQVAETVGARLGRTVLELSGNNGIVVDETADLKLAVPAVVFGAVGTAGQRCTTTRRVIAHESIFDDLAARLAHAYEQVRIGDPLEPGVLMGPLIEPTAVERFTAAIAEIKQLGGEILYGGQVIQGPGNFVQPTLVRAQPEWDIVKRETFAPILYLMRYRALDEAIAIHNDVPQGLSSAIFTTDLRHMERFLSATGSDCGFANVNIGTSGAEIGGAFGGEKDTGGGREAGSDAWKGYMRRQTTTINWSTELPLAQGIKFDIG
ncbi:MAG: aldehyde dehydrogenase family protein [Gammaproteobacteria bacterium]|nr:aldehyde dehydrogenase family protein [Gammaproteobacteria bacterium]NIR83081.1 aldehyde dehydrogenase family protein [Gammaproteobacteria bacterium]NIR90743.1 aldehyde dehydrogenase family protein [Gammaproteobacteria bacterium]NIU04234.1 aldehyde dehydrogenase family protein [Gammaproteobacteria bacterium]NIV51526.1 aldehyde dehydrogenase family protein [Gammaproteobacteria bacterium]